MATTTARDTLSSDQKILQGITKNLSTATTLTIGGVGYTPATLKAVFQREVDTLNALDGIRAQLKEYVDASHAMRAEVSVVRKALKSFLVGTYGVKAAQLLEEFGMAAPKTPGPKTTEMKANAVVKGLATRKARHTMGKRQKRSVVGTPAGTVDLHALAEGPPAAVAASPGAPSPASEVTSRR